jgi:hypothetical protein
MDPAEPAAAHTPTEGLIEIYAICIHVLECAGDNEG